MRGINRPLLQLRVLGFSLLQDGNVGVGVFPVRKKFFVPSQRACAGNVGICTLRSFRLQTVSARHRNQGEDPQGGIAGTLTSASLGGVKLGVLRVCLLQDGVSVLPGRWEILTADTDLGPRDGGLGQVESERVNFLNACFAHDEGSVIERETTPLAPKPTAGREIPLRLKTGSV